MLVGARTKLGGLMRFECASRTNVGLKRKINEDSILAATERGLWVVADGMGGHEAGEVASGAIVEHLATIGRPGSPADQRARFLDRGIAVEKYGGDDLLLHADLRHS